MGEWGSDRSGPEQSGKRTVATAGRLAAAHPQTSTKKATKAPRSRAIADPSESRVRAKRTLPDVSMPATARPDWSGAYPVSEWDEPGQAEPGAWESTREDTLVTPALTLTPVGRRRADTEARAINPQMAETLANAAIPHASETDSKALVVRQPTTLGVRERKDRVRTLRTSGIEYIPGRKVQRFVPEGTGARGRATAKAASFIRRHKTFLFVLAAITIASITIGSATGTFSALNTWANPDWSAQTQNQLAPTPTPPPAPDIVDAAHYAAKYGFDMPRNAQAISGAEFKRLTFMLPFAYSATAAYDHRYGASIEPEMLLWWTHSEGIDGHINYSNCANHAPISGQNYFTNIQNCPQANFWQLGFGNQFSVIYVLKNAFRDTHGDPNNKQLVQQVGQWVLNYDMSQGTVPRCGGYSCTFPAMTIDQIMSGINETTGVETTDNWWASVLSRDPAINVYMIAHALTFFNHEATKRWIGCYYNEPCWGYESNNLGDILTSWSSLKKAAHL